MQACLNLLTAVVTAWCPRLRGPNLQDQAKARPPTAASRADIRHMNHPITTIATETKELLAYLRGLGWQISLCWIPREQNEECDALSKKTGNGPDSIERFNDRQDWPDHQDRVPPTGQEMSVLEMPRLQCPA